MLVTCHVPLCHVTLCPPNNCDLAMTTDVYNGMHSHIVDSIMYQACVIASCLTVRRTTPTPNSKILYCCYACIPFKYFCLTQTRALHVNIPITNLAVLANDTVGSARPSRQHLVIARENIRHFFLHGVRHCPSTRAVARCPSFRDDYKSSVCCAWIEVQRSQLEPTGQPRPSDDT